MEEKVYKTRCGPIHYWIHCIDETLPTLVFLPGLTADHTLFDKQIEYFKDMYNIFVWDAPGHALSWPFTFDFDLFDKARWLYEILEIEGIQKPILVGQSMGAYVAQAFVELYKNTLYGFVSIDSAPLQRQYVTGIEIWLLKRMAPVYKWYPWKWLLKQGVTGVAETAYGRQVMHSIMMTYDGQKERYYTLAGHGYKMLACAMEKDLPYEIDCPAILICGLKDKAGSTKSYNKKWEKETSIPMYWIEDAGHNSNTDKPEVVNSILHTFIEQIQGDN